MTACSASWARSHSITAPGHGALRALTVMMAAVAAMASDARADDGQVRNAAQAQSAVIYALIRREFEVAGLIAAHPGLTIAVDGQGAPFLRYHVRSWQVYRHGMIGEFADQLSTEDGPLSTGLQIRFNAYPIAEIEQQSFTSGIVPPQAAAAALADPSMHQPYWLTSSCGVTMPARQLRFIVMADYNPQTAQPLIDAVFAAITRALAKETLGDLDR